MAMAPMIDQPLPAAINEAIASAIATAATEPTFVCPDCSVSFIFETLDDIHTEQMVYLYDTSFPDTEELLIIPRRCYCDLPLEKHIALWE